MLNSVAINLSHFFNLSEGRTLVIICTIVFLSICFSMLSYYFLCKIPAFLFNKPAIKFNYIGLFLLFLLIITWLFIHEQKLSLIFPLIIFFLFSYSLAVIDFKIMYLPDVLIFPLLAVGVVFNFLNPFGNIMLSIYGMFGGYLFLKFIAGTMQWANKQRQLGEGDIKLIAAYGAWVGVLKLPQLLVGATLCGIIHYLYSYWRDGQHKAAIPFGPSIVVSALYFQFIESYYPWIS